jgi:hypothetical protein
MDELIFSPEECQPIPKGTYTARVLKAEIKTSKAGNKYISCDVQIIQGASQGKLVDCNFHLWANDSKFRSDSRRKFARLVSSCGIQTEIKVNDLSVIVDKPFLVDIGEQEDNFGNVNCINGFNKLRGK